MTRYLSIFICFILAPSYPYVPGKSCGKFLCDLQVREHIWLRPLEEPELSLATQSEETTAWLQNCKDPLGGNINRPTWYLLWLVVMQRNYKSFSI